jgi:hypothetical protein
MKALLFGLISIVLASGSAYAAKKPSSLEENSRKIKAAVDGMSVLAASGVEEYKVRPTTDVKAALTEIAMNEGMIEKADELEWFTDGSQWETDSGNWGSSDMSEAYSYIMTRDEREVEDLHRQGMEKELAQYEADLKAAKQAFKGLLNTGVQFGVAPLGAVQCGVRFAALAILDPAGKVYIFAVEGSGC